LRGVRALIVDDDPESLEVAAAMLRAAGAEVRTAATAFRAHELVASWDPSVVLTDLSMPDEAGFALLRSMRSAMSRPRAKVPIIAVTAYASADNRARALQAGFDAYVTKPIDPIELAKVTGDVVRWAR